MVTLERCSEGTVVKDMAQKLTNRHTVGLHSAMDAQSECISLSSLADSFSQKETTVVDSAKQLTPLSPSVTLQPLIRASISPFD